MGNHFGSIVLAHYKLAHYCRPMKDDDYDTRSLGFLLGDVARLIRRRFDVRADELGLTRAQWRVLAQLRRREGINQSTLAEMLEVEPITMVRHIDRLVAKGLVERRSDPNDRRVWRLYLKEEVQPVLDRLREVSEQTRSEALAGIPDQQCEQLIDNLLLIKANLLGSDVPESKPPGKLLSAEQVARKGGIRSKIVKGKSAGGRVVKGRLAGSKVHGA